MGLKNWFVLAVTIWLGGCTLVRDAPDFPDPFAQERARAEAAAALEAEIRAKEVAEYKRRTAEAGEAIGDESIKLAACAKAYVLKYRSSKLTATELVRAAVSACGAFGAKIEQLALAVLPSEDAKNIRSHAERVAGEIALRALAETPEAK